MSGPMRVGVIGAGAGGLAALRHLTARPELFRATAFEQAAGLGGTWVYTDDIGVDKYGLPIHSSMYKLLKTNLPKEVMAFPDFPFPKHLPSFMSHKEVLKYLQDYAENYGLLKHIQFKQQVKSVQPLDNGEAKWRMQVEQVETNHVKDHYFDAIMVCNGHYSVPLQSAFPGQEQFEGRLLHSHAYRDPAQFAGRRVLVVGGGASGTDISMDLAAHAQQVTLLHRRPEPFKTYLPPNVNQTMSAIKHFGPKHVVLEDGSQLELDAVVVCTGYKYSFPFLSKECQLQNEDEHLTPLYKHLIHTKFPSMCFIGIPKTICPFPLFDCQIRFMLAHLRGDLPLPSEGEMNAEAEKDFWYRQEVLTLPKHKAHLFGMIQWEYNDALAKQAGFEPIPRVVQRLYDYVHEYRVTELPNYKKRQFQLMNDQEFKEVNSLQA